MKVIGQIFIKEKIIKESQAHRLNGAGVNLEKYQVAPYPDGEKSNFFLWGELWRKRELMNYLKQ